MTRLSAFSGSDISGSDSNSHCSNNSNSSNSGGSTGKGEDEDERLFLYGLRMPRLPPTMCMVMDRGCREKPVKTQIRSTVRNVNSSGDSSTSSSSSSSNIDSNSIAIDRCGIGSVIRRCTEEADRKESLREADEERILRGETCDPYDPFDPYSLTAL